MTIVIIKSAFSYLNNSEICGNRRTMFPRCGISFPFFNCRLAPLVARTNASRDASRVAL